MGNAAVEVVAEQLEPAVVVVLALEVGQLVLEVGFAVQAADFALTTENEVVIMVAVV